MNKILRIAFLYIITIGSGSALAQCGSNTFSGGTCTRSGNYHGEILPNNGCGTWTVVANYGPGRYFRMPVLQGGCYSISTCGNSIDTQLSIYQGGNTTSPYAKNDDGGPICSGLQASATITPNFTDYTRVQVSEFSCLPGGSASITVRVRQNNNLSFTSSSADMCQGQTRALVATPSPVASAVSGSGDLGTYSGTGVSGTTFTAPVPGGSSAIYTQTYSFGYCSTTQSIRVYRNPSTANAGGNQVICGSTTTLAANAPTYGSGQWSVVSGTASIANASSPTSSVTLTSNSVTLRWTVSNGPCTSSSDDVVITRDNVAPIVTCPSNVTVNTSAGNCFRSVSGLAPSTSDNCGVSSVTYTLANATTGSGNNDASGTDFNVGSTLVTYTATDAQGNSGSCFFTVTVNDNQNPSISCPSNITTNTDPNTCGAVETFTVTHSDNCSSTVSQLAGLASGSTFPVGTTTMTFRATDPSSNTSDCSFTITVNDNQNPTISCPGNISVSNDAGECNANVSWTEPTGADNCSGSVTTRTAGPAPGSAFPAPSTATITYQVLDQSGNTASCSFTVTVADTEDPVITCPSNIVVDNDQGQCSAVVNFADATATDNCSVTVSQTDGLPALSQFGVNSSPNTVEFTATDASGNTDVCSFTITVNDTEDPTIVCPANIVVDTDAGQCDAVVSWTPPLGADNCPGQSTMQTAGPTPGVTLAAQSVTTVSYQVTDAASNTASCSFTITVEDNVFPAVTCPADQNITFQNCQYTLLDYVGNSSVTISDNCAPLTVVQTPAIGTVITEETTVQVSATDPSGNESICAFTVSPLDNSVPTFDNCPTAPVQVSVNSSCEFFIPNYSNLSVSDDCNPTLTFTQSPAAGSPASTTTSVTVTVSDGTNSADCTFDVEPTDNIAPTIVCPATQTESVDANCQLTLPDYTGLAAANDNCDSSVDVTQSPTGVVTGNTVVTLTATDDNSNTATCTFTVEVEDDIAPTFSCPASVSRDFNANCQYVVEDLTGLAASISDNCAGQVTVSQSPSAGALVGATSSVVTLTATDASGNSANCQINLLLNDNTAPTVLCPTNQLAAVDANCDISLANYTSLVTATDNCPSLGSVSVTQSPVAGTSFDLNTDATVTVTMTASDGSNSSTCTFDVILQDQIAPTLQCPSDITVTGNGDCEFTAGNYTSLVAAQGGTSDNCDATLDYSQSPSAGTTVQGTTAITVTGTDDAGNEGTCTFNLIVEDNTNPTITCPPTQTAVVNANCQYTLTSYIPLASADDNCDQSLTITQSPVIGTVVTGANVTVTLTATDDNANSANCTFTVNYSDETAPLIACPSNQVVAADANCQFSLADYTSGFATTSDNCDVTVDVTQSPAVGSTQSGTTEVTLTASDDDGNSSTCRFDVTTIDNTDPTITCPADQVVSSSIVGGNCIFLVPDLTGTATTSDNCDVSVSVSQLPGQGNAISATTTVTLTAEDDNGNTSNCTFDLILNDDAAPTITCPGDFTVDADANCLYEISDYTSLAVASDNCAQAPTVTQGASPAIGSTIGVDVPTTITLIATDDSSNTASCTFDITAIDVTDPVLTCPSSPQTVAANSNCLVFMPDYTGSTLASDNCSTGMIITQSPVAGTAIGGTRVVTLSAADDAGNIGQCTVTVEIDDSSDPSIVCPQNQTVSTDATCGYSLADYTALATASDNCDLSVTVSQSPSVGSNVSGTTQVTLTAEDADGNTATCTFDVIGEDNEAPTLSNCPSNATVSVGPTCTYTVGSYSATVSDNCDGNPTITQAPLAGSLIGGVTVVTITATDASGNAATCSFTLTPEDVNDPTILNCPSDITQTNDESVCGAVVTYNSINAIDNCAGFVIPTLDQGLASGATFPVGTTQVVWIADDGNGNTTNCEFNVTITDDEDPIVLCPQNITQPADQGVCEAVVTYSAPTVTDNCTSPITPVLDAGLASGSSFPEGTTTVTYTGTDQAGNEGSCSFTVTVTDDEDPVITCPSDITVDNDPGLCSAVVTYSLPTVTDNCTNPIFPTLELGLASGETFPLGTTFIRYRAEDGSGNSSLCSFSVVVEDNEEPILTCPNDTSINCDATVAYDAATATDNCASVVSVSQVTPNNFPFGPTTVTFEGDDGNGNIGTCSFVVTVIDTVAPVLDACPSDQFESFDANCELSLPDYTGLASATDNCDGSVVISQIPAAATTVLGTTTVTIEAEDFAGNVSTCTFTVTDDTPPLVSCPGDQQVGSDINCQYELLDYMALAAASDNCGSVTLIQSPAVGDLISGQTTVTITAEDDFGNTSSCTLDIILFDNIAPSITCIGNQSVFFDANCEYQLPDYTGQAVTDDNCDFTLDVTQSPAAGSTISGASAITLTVQDDDGNQSSCQFNVVPVDNIPPTIVCPSTQAADFDATCAFELADYTTSGTANDNCASVITVSQQPAIGSVHAANTIVTLTAEDENGNTANCNFLVVPEDNVAPTIDCPADLPVDLQANCQAQLSDYTSLGTPSDNCSAVFVITQSPASGTLVTESTTIELTVTDENGNQGSCTFNVLPEDNEPPTIACIADQEVSFDQNCEFAVGDYNGSATVSDNCSTAGQIVVSQIPAAGTNVDEETIVTLVAQDESGNTASCNFTVTPVDDEPPTITCPADQNVSFNGNCTYALMNYTSVAIASDNCSSNTVVTQNVAQGTIVTGQTTITLTANDGNGNTATCSFDVIPSDNTAPLLACPSDQLVQFDANCSFTLSSYTSMAQASDNCSVILSQFPDEGTQITASTEITIQAVDGAGNTTQCTFDVLPEDAGAPTVTCPSDVQVDLDANCQFQLPDYTADAVASDNCTSGNFTYSQFPPQGTFIVGDTELEITVQDETGNTATCTFQVEPEDNLDPVVTQCPDDLSVVLNSNCEYLVPNFSSGMVAEDNCDAQLSFQQAPAAGFVVSDTTGTFTVQVGAFDDAGNVAVCQFELTLVDESDPVIVCPSDQLLSLTADCDYVLPDYTSLANASDACGSVTVTQSPAAGTSVTGQSNPTLIVEDQSGNTASCTFLVNIINYELEVTGTDVTCLNGNDGTATVSVSGGQAPYAEDWGGFDPNALEPGLYTVSVSDANGCVLVGQVEINNGPSFELQTDPSGLVEICEGSSVTIDAGAGYADYNWSNGASVQVITVSNPGQYWISVTSAEGCVSSTDTITVAFYETVAPTVSSDANGILTCSNDTAASYQWYLNGAPIANATDVTYCPLESGNYAVEIVDDNGCEISSALVEYTFSDDSPCATSVDEYGLSMDIYPNPSTGVFTIDYALEKQVAMELSVFDMFGKQVLEAESIRTKSGTRALDLSSEAEGVYFIRILLDGEQIVQHRLVIVR